jgi:hypothetical protein
MNIDHALTDPAFFVANDPHPIWKRLRHEGPIRWTQGLVSPFWSVTREPASAVTLIVDSDGRAG